MAVHSESNTGRIHLCSDGSSVAFAELSATYPLKLLSPRIPHPGVAVVYVLSYGGGLVAGDFIQLAIEVEKQSILVALTQAWPNLAQLEHTLMLCAFRDPRKCSRCAQGKGHRAEDLFLQDQGFRLQLK
jgi:hypothetical protein